ncbi:MAG: hypothetical protein J0L67_04040 [Cytophagales bacterium]|nr:hypothetical protein [Cytophagales bacterium]
METGKSNKNNRPKWVQEIFDNENDFWKKTYPQKTEEEKVKYWASTLYRDMRQQEESGLIIYNIYSSIWLTNTLEKEPDFLNMLPKIYSIMVRYV